jgi:hypothetical protein
MSTTKPFDMQVCGSPETMHLLLQGVRTSLTTTRAMQCISDAIVNGHVDVFAIIYRRRCLFNRITMEQEASQRIDRCAKHGRVEISELRCAN